MIKSFLKHALTVHRQGLARNIFIFSTARSGTTWLAEMLATQDKFKIVNEPFNIRCPVKRRNVGLECWDELLLPSNRIHLERCLEMYIQGKDTDPRNKRERPLSEFWHPVTTRIIFKILFAGEDCIEWLSNRFNGDVILLFRHPFAVSLSRKQFPRLDALMSSPFSRHFSKDQMKYAAQIVDSEDKFQIGVLDWCLQNSVPFRSARTDWLMISYEQMVLQPERVIDHLASELKLPHPQKMLDRVFVPSASVGHSKRQSREVLADSDMIRDRRLEIAARWRSSVSSLAQRRAFTTLEIFGIDCYADGHVLPVSRILI